MKCDLVCGLLATGQRFVESVCILYLFFIYYLVYILYKQVLEATRLHGITTKTNTIKIFRAEKPSYFICDGFIRLLQIFNTLLEAKDDILSSEEEDG